jgi:hypothetical protein
MNRIVLATALLLAGCGTSGVILPIQLSPAQTKASEAPEVGAEQSRSVGEVVASRESIIARRGADFTNAAGIRLQYIEGTALGYTWYCNQAMVECLRDREGRGVFDEVRSGPRVAPINAILYQTQTLSIPYKIVDTVGVDQSSFRYQLIYQGLDGRTARLTYREYTNDMARPAFQQDLTYTLEPSGRPTDVSFRGLQMTILRADNNGITYRVRRGFSAPSS